MKNLKSVKMLAIAVAVISLASCRKEKQDPILDVKFEMEKTDQFEYAEVSFSQLFLFGEDESGKAFKSNLQNMNKSTMGGFLLERGGVQDMTKQSHFEMKVVALKADASLYLHLTKNGTVQKVYESVGDGKIILETPVFLNANEAYEVKLIMNTEEALKIKNNKLAIDWSEVRARIVKK